VEAIDEKEKVWAFGLVNLRWSKVLLHGLVRLLSKIGRSHVTYLRME
jgi:hypothetical protein